MRNILIGMSFGCLLVSSAYASETKVALDETVPYSKQTPSQQTETLPLEFSGFAVDPAHPHSSYTNFLKEWRENLKTSPLTKEQAESVYGLYAKDIRALLKSNEAKGKLKIWPLLALFQMISNDQNCASKDAATYLQTQATTLWEKIENRLKLFTNVYVARVKSVHALGVQSNKIDHQVQTTITNEINNNQGKWKKWFPLVLVSKKELLDNAVLYWKDQSIKKYLKEEQAKRS